MPQQLCKPYRRPVDYCKYALENFKWINKLTNLNLGVLFSGWFSFCFYFQTKNSAKIANSRTHIGSGTGMCRSHDPFFQASWRSVSYQFTIIALLMCTPFSILEKNCIFEPCFCQNFSCKTQIFQIFIPKTPHFSRKIHSLDPTFGNPCGTYPPKKLSAPRPSSPPPIKLSAPHPSPLKGLQISFQRKSRDMT